MVDLNNEKIKETVNGSIQEVLDNCISMDHRFSNSRNL
jgi:hypothetical protein